ncbi:MAG TPA: DUF1259 domain-containing protein [Gemmatimonadaceae bacterium]|nr:DUF1259 domain-containing protein [Gemmatimonadaceae bacterium]
MPAHSKFQRAMAGLALLATWTLPCGADAQRTSSSSAASDWGAVETALGRKGAMQPGGVIKFGFPRSDLTVKVGAVTLAPALALGSWVAFERTADGKAMAMGDLVLTDAEVGPVMATLQQNGVEQSALHNHLLEESPHLMYMHIMANGDAATIARAIRAALAKSATPLGSPGPAAAPSAAGLDTQAIGAALGVHGKLNGRVYQVAVPRSETINEMGVTVPPSMGVATSINFQPTTAGKAAVTGDFVLLGSEVNPVIRALRDHGIQVTALHSHLIDETPRLYFMHYWANDDALSLAKGLRAALDQTASKKD